MYDVDTCLLFRPLPINVDVTLSPNMVDYDIVVDPTDQHQQTVIVVCRVRLAYTPGSEFFIPAFWRLSVGLEPVCERTFLPPAPNLGDEEYDLIHPMLCRQKLFLFGYENSTKRGSIGNSAGRKKKNLSDEDEEDGMDSGFRGCIVAEHSFAENY